MFVPSFLALWWPKIDRKSGFPQLHHIILDGVIVVLDCMFLWFSYKFALLWQIFLRFPNFLYQLQPRYLPYHDTLVGRVMPKFFSNKFFLNDSHQCSYHNDLKIGLFVGYFLMGWVLIRAGVYCPHLWAQLVSSESSSRLSQFETPWNTYVMYRDDWFTTDITGPSIPLPWPLTLVIGGSQMGSSLPIMASNMDKIGHWTIIYVNKHL